MEGFTQLAIPILATYENEQIIEVNTFISGGVKFRFVFNNYIPYE